MSFNYHASKLYLLDPWCKHINLPIALKSTLLLFQLSICIWYVFCTMFLLSGWPDVWFEQVKSASAGTRDSTLAKLRTYC
jgi:hypothetical protein